MANVAWSATVGWNTQNRPPLEEAELRKVFNSILRAEREQKSAEDFDAAFSKYAPLDAPGTAEPTAGGTPSPATTTRAWRLVIVESDPRTFKLYSPWWHEKGKGYLALSGEEMRRAESIGLAALLQLKTWLEPKSFGLFWHGDKKRKGMAACLMEEAESEAAPLEQRRELVVASLLFEYLRNAAANPRDPDNPDAGGRPTKVSNGSIMFRFDFMWADLSSTADKITRIELAELLTQIKASVKSLGPKNSRVRYRVVTPESFQILDKIVFSDPPEE